MSSSRALQSALLSCLNVCACEQGGVIIKGVMNSETHLLAQADPLVVLCYVAAAAATSVSQQVCNAHQSRTRGNDRSTYLLS